ncbi:MAG: AAA family ATPase [Candidatus Thermoplasmatota archaeon]
MVQLILIRGLPDSGKSTMVREYVKQGYLHFEADMYFERDGKYEFRPALLPKAHAWCLSQTKRALEEGKDVVVSNTFSRKWELQPYLDLGYPTKILTATGNYKNIHGVPDETIKRMKDRWED